MSAGPVREALVEELLHSGWLRELIWHSQIDSTSEEARRRLQSDSINMPALFVADQQTAGRGRGKHSWWSPPGCLVFTLAVSSSQLPHDRSCWGQLALIAGVAVAETVELLAPQARPQLKWPNDGYLAGKKFAGILIETTPVGNQAAEAHLLIGIGINVCIDWSEAPQQVAARATCLRNACGGKIEREDVLVELINRLRLRVDQWNAGSLQWLGDWRDRCLLNGKMLRIRQAAECELVGRCDGIDDDGRLILRTQQGVRFVAGGEVVDWQ